jgi:integrase/recombinase XerD
MHLLHLGVDITAIALWLGHEGTATTHRYIESNLALKKNSLSRIEEMPSIPLRYPADDELLRFLEGL